MNEPITKNQLGLLVRLKAYTMVGTNIIPFSLNQIVHIVSANHDAIYASMKIGLLERYEKIGFRFLKEELFPIN